MKRLQKLVFQSEIVLQAGRFCLMEKSKLVVTEEDELENQGEQLLKAIFGTFALSRILCKENNQPLCGKKWLGPGLKKSSLYLQRNFSMNTGIDQYQKHFLEFSDHQVFDARIEKWLHRWIFSLLLHLPSRSQQNLNLSFR